MADIRFVQADTLKEKPADVSKVGFGRVFTDYMFEMVYNPEEGWHDARIVPYQDVPLSPANATLHYGQAIFEGCKAYRYEGGKAVVFRAKDHIARLNRSAKILDIPEVDEKLVYDALMKLIDLEKDWIPDGPGQSLYIRPFIFSTDPYLGVSVGQYYKMMIILSPVGAYYANGFAPVKIMVEDTYVRAPKGGLGAAKTPANYAASLHGGLIAHEKGYDQTLWTDGIEHKYIGEVGSMNILFKIDGNIPLQNQQSTDFLGRHTEYGLVNLINQTVSLLCVQMNSRTQEPALTYTLQGSTQFWLKNNRQSHKQEIYAFGEKPINSMKLQT